MARPHVEFIQSQQLAWAPAPWGWLEGCDVKMLSADAENGGATALVRLPAGWRSKESGHLCSHWELLVIDGSVLINERAYEQDCYAFFPAGHGLQSITAKETTTLLVLFDSLPAWVSGAAAAGQFDTSAAVEFLDAYEMRWECAGMDPAYADTGLRWKILRHDPGRQETTMLVTCPPHLHPPDWSGPQEIHDCVEEMFLLSGDYLSNVGIMREGAYFWRPPGIRHGPYGTRGGNLALIRTLGAPLENNWTGEFRISRNPPLRPALPRDMQGIMARDERARY
jgi:hypothetical protein